MLFLTAIIVHSTSLPLSFAPSPPPLYNYSPHFSIITASLVQIRSNVNDLIMAPNPASQAPNNVDHPIHCRNTIKVRSSWYRLVAKSAWFSTQIIPSSTLQKTPSSRTVPLLWSHYKHMLYDILRCRVARPCPCPCSGGYKWVLLHAEVFLNCPSDDRPILIMLWNWCAVLENKVELNRGGGRRSIKTVMNRPPELVEDERGCGELRFDIFIELAKRQ